MKLTFQTLLVAHLITAGTAAHAETLRFHCVARLSVPRDGRDTVVVENGIARETTHNRPNTTWELLAGSFDYALYSSADPEDRISGHSELAERSHSVYGGIFDNTLYYYMYADDAVARIDLDPRNGNQLTLDDGTTVAAQCEFP